MPPPDSHLAAPGGRVVFVYYRIRPSRVRALLQAFEEGMAKAGTWKAQLMRKVDTASPGVRVDGQSGTDHENGVLQTWLEIYCLSEEAPPANDALQAAIERLARAAGIVALVEGERHYEIFEPCA